ncbi:helix-turn-helix domain-containing protein [Paenibacillus sp. NPDC058174]|uniref:helix-turn-helix domain-containing protein n=1 Tax=Paenibacillus sp. NPDC058174 TaxID=3346366 RepID=UPI0036D99523
MSRIERQQEEPQWIAHWQSTKPLEDKWMAAGEVHYFPCPAFLLITDGQAMWSINGQLVHAAFGQLIAVEASSVIEVVEGGNLDLAGWLIQFHAFALNNDEAFEWKVPAGDTFQQVQLTGGFLTGISDYLNEEQPEQTSRMLVEHQYFLYGLLRSLYQKQPDERQTTRAGILRSIAYMQEHYEEVITREQLAQIAGISPWHYSRKFSEWCGKRPSDYLAAYRMYRAQEELLLTSAKSQEIARKTGFEDVHYFSRRFKHMTGVSPKNYARTLPQRKIVSLSPLCAEVLIALGVTPHAVMATPLLLSGHHRDLFDKHQVKLLEVPQYVIPVELIEQAEPALIVGHFLTEDMKRRLRTIGPVLTGLPVDIAPLLERFAELFDKGAEAQSIQLRMTNEVNAARHRLKAVIEAKASVMVLRVEPFGYRYLGGNSSGVSQLLYHKLGLTLPHGLKAGKAWFNPCSLEQLAAADPEYLFIEKRVMENFSAEENMEKLMDSSCWANLRAVRNGRVFYADTRIWVDGCGIAGQSIILNQIVSGLTETRQEAHNNPIE